MPSLCMTRRQTAAIGPGLPADGSRCRWQQRKATRQSAHEPAAKHPPRRGSRCGTTRRCDPERGACRRRCERGSQQPRTSAGPPGLTAWFLDRGAERTVPRAVGRGRRDGAVQPSRAGGFRAVDAQRDGDGGRHVQPPPGRARRGSLRSARASGGRKPAARGPAPSRRGWPPSVGGGTVRPSGRQRFAERDALRVVPCAPAAGGGRTRPPQGLRHRRPRHPWRGPTAERGRNHHVHQPARSGRSRFVAGGRRARPRHPWAFAGSGSRGQGG